ncbi:MAG: hypothetical protein ACLQJR_32140 [Stellaceae bacterium]
MADITSITGDSPEAVALRLCEMVISDGQKPAGADAIKKWLLDTYAECLLAVTNPKRTLKVGSSSRAD